MNVHVAVRHTRLRDGVGDDRAVLSPRELGSLEVFTEERDRRRRVAGRSLVRRYLAERHAIEPSEVPLAVEPSGRPATPLIDGLSITHAGEIIAAAFSRSDIGIDVEPIVPLDDLDALIAAYAHTNEVADLTAHGGAERARAFLAMWTRKEALFKACGRGLQLPPCMIDVRADVVHAFGRTWRLLPLELDDAHLAALAVAIDAVHTVSVDAVYVNAVPRRRKTTFYDSLVTHEQGVHA